MKKPATNTVTLPMSEFKPLPGNKYSPPQDQGTVSVTGSSNNNLDDKFGLFSSGPPAPLQQPLPSSNTSVVSSQGWETIPQSLSSKLLSTAVTTSGESSTRALSVAPVTTTSSMVTSSAFDDILPPELVSLRHKDSDSATGLQEGSALGMVNKKPSPKAEPKLTKKMTGLEILEEEMNRAATSAESSKPPSFPLQSLVPEPVGPNSATSLDSFGEFESFSGSKEKGDDLESTSGSLTGLVGHNKVRVVMNNTCTLIRLSSRCKRVNTLCWFVH